MVIDLKLALFGVIVTLISVFWLGWRGIRRQPIFDFKQSPIWQTFPCGLIILSPAFAVRFANRAAYRLLDVSGELVESEHYGRLLQKIKRDSSLQHFPLTLSQDAILDVWIGPIGNARLIFLRDLTEQRQRDIELQLYWGKISHELRTPLTSMLSHLELSRSQNISPELQAHSLEIVHQQTQRLTKLIHSTLELGRLKISQPFDKTKADIILIAEEAIAALILLAEAQGINLDFFCDTPIPPVLGNPDKLKQLFINLLDNAMKYCQPGDSISVSLAVDGDVVRCEVRDTGSGVAEEHLSQLTQQFYRVRRDVPGSGLGLAIVDEIVHQHNGRLTIQSSIKPPTGTAVSFTLPFLPGTMDDPA
ncbi:MAG: GHKL domain-containing protein [Anaerolineales bacterium]|nr:GHKL domain-containing protein [Anaerolineales bacterium]